MAREEHIINGGGNVTILDVWKVAHNKFKLILGDNIKSKIKKSRAVIEKAIADEKLVYGVTTGFGDFQNKFINTGEVQQLQANLIRSHCVGVGALYSREEVRAAMFCRLVSNCQGNSGVRLELMEKIVEFLNKDVIPAVPSQGSVGASGDLAPLSHFVLALMGEGEVLHENGVKNTKEVLKKAQIKPIVLEAKEGLALNNGTSFMAGISALNLVAAEDLCKISDVSATICLEACEGFSAAFDERPQLIRPHHGQITTAKNVRALIHGSTLVDYSLKRSNEDDLKKVQDSYSLRCVPQVHGAVKDVVGYCKKVIEIELNSVTDNPLIFPENGDVISSGNFHGAPIAYAMDFLAIALTDLGNISERRIYKLINEEPSSGLPSCLIKNGGLNSGLMITQYTAASRCGENQVLSHPASVGTIPTSGTQEDHVSFGSISTNKCRSVIENLRHIFSIELLCGYQGIFFRHEIIQKHDKKFQTINGDGPNLVVDLIRKTGVDRFENDSLFGEDMKKIYQLIKTSEILKAIEAAGIEISA